MSTELYQPVTLYNIITGVYYAFMKSSEVSSNTRVHDSNQLIKFIQQNNRGALCCGRFSSYYPLQ